MIHFDHVTKLYGITHALSDVSFHIDKGEFVFLIGPSGAGKTTCLRLIISEITPSKGTIVVDGTSLANIPPSKTHLLRRKVGTVFQDFKLLFDRTVYENVALALEILGRKDTEVKKDVHDVLELVGLGRKANLFPQQLSAGELQRTSIARAIAGGPTILLADEPTGNLDPETAGEILQILQEINRMGTTVVMATHNATVVNELRKRTITLEDGQLVSDEAKGKYQIRKRTAK
ncbi:cell division ATP-binding protein FtsE [Candidatus Gottesmanbacteria bacterium]|nr:cell division ATP-binding protein FtsE [Candidatus Gottesmanbacteria bacterium]